MTDPVPAPVPTLAERLQQRIEKSCEANRFCLQFFLFAHAHEAGEDGIKAAIQTAFDNVAKETRELLAALTPEPVRPTGSNLQGQEFIDIDDDIRVIRIYRDGSWVEVINGRRQRHCSFPEPEANSVSAPPTPPAYMTAEDIKQWLKEHPAPPWLVQHLMAENARLDELANDRGNEAIRLEQVRAKAYSIVEMAEWQVITGHGDACPICDQLEKTGHADWCWLQQVIFLVAPPEDRR